MAESAKVRAKLRGPFRVYGHELAHLKPFSSDNARDTASAQNRQIQPNVRPTGLVPFPQGIGMAVFATRDNAPPD